MKGLQVLVVGKELIMEAVQEYLSNYISQNVEVTSVSPITVYSDTKTVVVPEKFQITLKPYK